MSVEIKTAMGTARATIHAKLRNRYSNMVNKSKPFPKNLSTALKKKLMNRINTIIPRAKIKGNISSLTI